MIFFFGVDPIKVDEIMPDLIKTLGLGSPTHVICLDKTRAYNKEGKLLDREQSILVVERVVAGQGANLSIRVADLSARIGLPIEITKTGTEGVRATRDLHELIGSHHQLE